MRTMITKKGVDFAAVRRDFPILEQLNRGKPLIYLDSAASAQKPRQVIDAISHFYSNDYANIHRGVYALSERATQQYESTRERIQQFIHAAHAEEIVYVRGATEGINLVAQSYGRANWCAGDEIIISEMEHHANIVPWYLLREQVGIVLKIIPLLDDGSLDIRAYQQLFSSRTKLVTIAHASNAIGTLNPIKLMTAMAHAHHVPVLIDGAQAVARLPIDVQDIDCDFYVFSGHKLYGPTGIGILYGKKNLLAQMPPYQGGGDMIEAVSFAHITFAKPPHRFEAGTPAIASVVGLAAAIQYLENRGMQTIALHEQALLQSAEAKLLTIPGLRIIGTTSEKIGVISFVIEGIHPHDIATVLDHEGLAVRAGHHCAMPLMERFKLPATVRISFGIYNQEQELDVLMAALHLVKRLFA